MALDSWTVDGAEYSKRKKLTYDSDAILTSSLTDFTVAGHLDNGESDFWDNSPPVTGDGVRFATEDGLTLYKFQVESYDTTGDDAWWHVKITTLDHTADTDIYIYYDVDVESDGEDKENAWDAFYTAVYLLNADQAEGAFDDATSNNLNLTETSSSDIAMQVDKGRDFNGSTDELHVSSASLNIGTDDFCVECWFEPDSEHTARVLSKEEDPAGYGYWISNVGTTLNVGFTVKVPFAANVVNITSAVVANTKVHAGMRVDRSDSVFAYADGVEGTPTDCSSEDGQDGDSTSDFMVGRRPAGLVFDGSIDMITISIGDARTAEWMAARHASGLGTWLTVGAMEERIPITVTPDPLIVSSTLPDPVITGQVIVTPDPLIITSFIPIAFVQSVLIEADALVVTTTMPVPTVDAPTIVAPGAFTVTISMPDPSVLADTRLIAVNGFPSGKTVSYKILDLQSAVLQDWTVVGVAEDVIDATAGTSQYSALSNLATGVAQVKIHWKTNDATPLTASEIISIEAAKIAAIEREVTNYDQYKADVSLIKALLLQG